MEEISENIRSRLAANRKTMEMIGNKL
jgi:hypothetical protein